MKKNIIIGVVAVLLVLGCQDNFLETAPFDSLSESQFWQNEEHAMSGVLGIYQNLTYDNVYGYYFQRDALTPYVYSDDRMAGFNIGSISNRDGLFSDTWDELYRGVQRANDAISKLPNVPGLSDATRTQFIAESKFLRALFYFNLLDVFGGVPIYNEPVDLQDAYKPRSIAADVRALMLSDLTDAIEGLPETVPSTDRGRATKGAAIALRGKVYLYNQQWSEAETDFKTVMDMGLYQLHPSYSELFSKEYETVSEHIFSVQFIEDPVLGNDMQWALANGSHPPGNNFASYVASNILVDTYEYVDGSDFDWETLIPGFNSMTPQEKDVIFLMDDLSEGQREQYLSTPELEALYIEGGNEDRIKQAWENRDPRMTSTIILPYTSFIGKDGIEWTRRYPGRSFNAPKYDVISRPGALHFFNKLVVKTDDLANRTWGPIDIPVIRYADVLLMYAEARNENSGLDNQVLDAINEVRQRAGIADLQTTNASEPTFVASTDEMRERIRRERAVEFVLEGTYYSDIRRWDIGGEVNNHEIQFFNGAPVRTRVWHDHYNLWPIPPAEIDNNPALTQNPGWG